MGYISIDNLYKNQDILMFKECYALEKIHGTSAHISYKAEGEEVKFFSGGEKHEKFVTLFDEEFLKNKFKESGVEQVTVYGEAYGGKCQGMSKVYGDKLRFVAFDVKIGDYWLAVPQAEEFVKSLGLEFVTYNKISTDLRDIDSERDKVSIQSILNGADSWPGCHPREGIVLRPLIELRKNNDARIMSKHKTDAYAETHSKREVTDPEKLKVLADARAVAEEWVTPMRLNHVLDKIENPCMEKMRNIITSMIEDVKREGEGEIVWSKTVGKYIGSRTAQMTKEYFKSKLLEKV